MLQLPTALWYSSVFGGAFARKLLIFYRNRTLKTSARSLLAQRLSIPIPLLSFLGTGRNVFSNCIYRSPELSWFLSLLASSVKCPANSVTRNGPRLNPSTNKAAIPDMSAVLLLPTPKKGKSFRLY